MAEGCTQMTVKLRIAAFRPSPTDAQAGAASAGLAS